MKRFADKAELPAQLLLDTVQNTVESFHSAWKTSQDLPLPQEVRSTITAHLKTLPLYF